MSDIKTRKFKCTGCGEGRPCYLETNRESSIMDVYTEDTLKCVMDETNRTGYNWEEVQANDVTTGEKQCNLPVVTPRYFYVVEPNSEEGLDQISIGLESLERAKKFKDTEYHKKTYPNSFIVCTFNEG